MSGREARTPFFELPLVGGAFLPENAQNSLLKTANVISPQCLLLCSGDKDLATAIHATVRASMVRKPGLFAVWACDQLWQVKVMVCASLTLTGARDTLFWQCSH